VLIDYTFLPLVKHRFVVLEPGVRTGESRESRGQYMFINLLCFDSIFFKKIYKLKAKW